MDWFCAQRHEIKPLKPPTNQHFVNSTLMCNHVKCSVSGFFFFALGVKEIGYWMGGSNGPHYHYPCPYHFSCHKSIWDSKMMWDFPGRSWHKPNQLSKLRAWTCFILLKLKITRKYVPGPFVHKRAFFKFISGLSSPNNTPKPSFVQRRRKEGPKTRRDRGLAGAPVSQMLALEKGAGATPESGRVSKKPRKSALKFIREKKRDSVCLSI